MAEYWAPDGSFLWHIISNENINIHLRNSDYIVEKSKNFPAKDHLKLSQR